MRDLVYAIAVLLSGTFWWSAWEVRNDNPPGPVRTTAIIFGIVFGVLTLFLIGRWL